MGFASKLFVFMAAGVALFFGYAFLLDKGAYSATVAILAVVLGFLIWVWGRTPAPRMRTTEEESAYMRRIQEIEAEREMRKEARKAASMREDS